MKKNKIPLYRLIGGTPDSTVVVYQEPHETLAADNQIVVPLAQEVEVVIDEETSGEIQRINSRLTG